MIIAQPSVLPSDADLDEWAETGLAPNHVADLQRSGILPHVAMDRPYQTATTIREVKRLGFAESQCLVPGLLIPFYNVAGQLDGYGFKPDTPRMKDGKVVKYERPPKHPGTLDVPPSARDRVMNPEFSLLITEGTKKADSAASREFACVSLPGVWNWREPTIMAALDIIPLRDRCVYLAFDSDWRRKPLVREAMDRLAAVLKQYRAIVYTLDLPEPTPGVKVGLDDWFVGA